MVNGYEIFHTSKYEDSECKNTGHKCCPENSSMLVAWMKGRGRKTVVESHISQLSAVFIFESLSWFTPSCRKENMVTVW